MNNSRILAIETAIGNGSVALMLNGEILASKPGSEISSWSSQLIPAIESIYREAGIALSETDLIAVSRGPGSFTGIRIGLASATAFANALACEICGVSCLEVIAAASPVEGNLDVGIDAGRDHVFFQKYSKFGDDIRAVSDPMFLSYTQLELEEANDRKKLVVHSSLKTKLALANFPLAPERYFVVTEDLAPFLAGCAAKQIQSGLLTSPEPMYLRGALR